MSTRTRSFGTISGSAFLNGVTMYWVNLFLSSKGLRRSEGEQGSQIVQPVLHGGSSHRPPPVRL